MDHQPNLKSALAREIDTQTLKFKPKFLGQSPREILDKAHCQICFKFHELKTGRRRITKEPGLDMLQCYGCGVVVHHYCYGIRTPVNEISTDSEYCLKMFVCDKCKFQGPKAVEECAICSQFDGAFKKVSENVYVHVMCALFSQEYKVTDFEKMEIEVDQDQIGLKKRSHLPCVYCKNSNGTVGCNDSSCKEACHPYCAYLNKIKYLSEDEESPFGWKISFTRELNTNEVSVRLLEARVDERIRKIYDRMAGLLENGTQDSGSILKLMKSINQEKKSVLKHAIKKAEEEMIDVYSLLPDYEQSGYIGYGPVEAECEKHRLPDPLCVCHSYFDGSKLMFGCDSCENWFHCACLNVPEDAIPEMKEYSCDKCKSWAAIKNQFFQKEMIVETSQAVETQDGNGIVPQDTRGFWITDYIITAIIFQNKALQTLSNPSEFKQSIKELIESIEYIPLQLDAIIIQVFETYYTAIATEEAFLNLFPSQNKVKKALDFSEEAQSTKFGEKKARKISKVIKQLEDVMDICRQEGVLLASLEAKIVKLISINKWKVDFYRLWGQMPKEESLSEIKSLEERARTLQISPELPERKHLQTFYNATGEWIVNSTKFFWKKNPLYLHKVKDLKSITLNGTTYKVALETLDKNMQALKEDIQAKHSLEELQAFIQQGEMLDSNTKESLSILRKEIDEAETLRRDLKLKPKSLEDVEEKLFKIEEAVIRVPEAIEAITYYYELKKIKLMLENYVRNCEGAIEGGQEAIIIDVKEVEEKLHEIEKLQIDFGEEQNILANKVEEIRAFEALVEKNLSKFVDLEVLKELQRKANEFGFKTSKAFEIQKKYDTVKRMHETFDDFFVNNSNEEGTDEDLSFEDSDLEFSPRQSKVSQPKKIEIIEIEDDNCLSEESESQMSDPWLNDLVEFYTTWVLSGSKLSYPKSTESQLEQIQLWIQENVEITQTVYKHFNEFQKIISKGLYLNYNDERVLTVFIYHAKMYWNFSIKRLISGIYDLQEENLMTLEQLAKQLDNGQSEDHYKLYKELFVDFYEWISTYKALSTSDLYTSFLDDLNINEDQLQTLGSTLHDLLERSAILKIKIDVEEKIKIDIEEKAKDLEKALGHLSWANSAKNLLADANQKGKLDFELIKMTNIKANMINIPKECSLYKKFSMFLQDLTLYQENLEIFNNSRVFIKTKLAQTFKNMSNSKMDSQIKLLKLQKQKPTLTQGLSLQKSWKEKGYTHDQEEQEQIVKEIRACLDWQEKVKKFFDTYQLEDNEYLGLDNVEGIAQGLNKIMTEMIWLILRDDETEILIYQLEWRFHAKLLLNGRERSKKEEREEPGNGVTEWRKLLKIADKRTELSLGDTVLYNLAKEQVEIYNDLMTKISVIKEHDYFLNKALMSPNADIKQLRKGLRQEEDLKLLTKKLLACRIDAQEGRQYLESLLEKIYHIKSCFNELKTKLEALKQAEIGLKASMQRSFKSEARALLIKIHTLPLRLPHEERFLEECEEKSQEYMTNTGGVKIQRALYLQEEEKIGNREIQLVLKKDASREELFNNQKDSSLLRKRTDTERDEMEESRITSNKLSNQKLMEEEAFEENEEATLKKLKIQGSLDGQERQQKETGQPNFEKITEKCRTEARRRISDTLRDMKDFDISVKQVKRETITKKLEKCLYHDSGEDKLKYKEKLEKLCNLLRNQRPSTRKTQNAEANHNAVQRETLTEFYRRRPAFEQTSIPQDGPSPDSLGSDDEMQKKISTRCHSGLCSETGQFNEGGEPNFEIEGIYQPEAWSSEQSYEISMNERVSEHSESTHTEVLSRLTVNSQNLSQNAVPAPILLSLCHLQLNSFITMLPEEKKQKFVSEYKKTSECYSHLFGIPAAPVLTHHQSNPQPQPQTQPEPEPKTLSSIQHLPRPLLSSTKSQPFPFVRVQSTGQNLECVRGPFMNVDYAGSLRKSQSVVSDKSSLPQQRVLAPSILVNTKSNNSVLDENSKQK